MRYYIDTSVFGGYYDNEFQDDTRRLFAEIEKGEMLVVISELTARELFRAPQEVQELLDRIPTGKLDVFSITDETTALAEHYIEEGALAKKSISDAQHIATATVARVDVLVSWNFRHMVNFFRVRQYNSINLRYGYPTIDIRSPREVLHEK
ncbi:MAG: PIN domain-containing protein [Ignavibacteriae bacterium]|nr:PIN domain-containing protein [Ignavibacteriota bacterium]